MSTHLVADLLQLRAPAREVRGGRRLEAGRPHNHGLLGRGQDALALHRGQVVSLRRLKKMMLWLRLASLLLLRDRLLLSQRLLSLRLLGLLLSKLLVLQNGMLLMLLRHFLLMLRGLLEMHLPWLLWPRRIRRRQWSLQKWLLLLRQLPVLQTWPHRQLRLLLQRLRLRFPMRRVWRHQIPKLLQVLMRRLPYMLMRLPLLTLWQLLLTRRLTMG